MSNFKKVILVGSGKGGVGKSTVSAGIAVNLAKLGEKVGLLDADIYGPSQDLMFDLKNGEVFDNDQEDIMPTIKNYGVRCVSIGSIVKDSQALAWRGPMLASALKQMVEKSNWEGIDTLVVDLPPGTGDVVMTMAKLVKPTGAVIVSTPQDVAMLDAKKAYDMFNKLNIPIAGFVENMSYHICSKCGSKEYIFGKNGVKDYVKSVDSLFLGDIPLNISIRQTSDKGQSLEKFEEFNKITQKLSQQLEQLKQQPIKVVID